MVREASLIISFLVRRAFRHNAGDFDADTSKAKLTCIDLRPTPFGIEETRMIPAAYFYCRARHALAESALISCSSRAMPIRLYCRRDDGLHFTRAWRGITQVKYMTRR